MGLKTENVENVLVLQQSLKGMAPTADSVLEDWRSLEHRIDVEKGISLIKNALCLYSELSLLHRRGAPFHKIHET